MLFEFLHPWKKQKQDELPELPKPNSDNSEQGYIAEGWGNGSLHPHVVRNPESYWDGGHSSDDFYVGFDFHPWDWEAVFFDALGCSTWQEIEAESNEEREQKYHDIFNQRTSEYPMLSRINDLYQDAGYRFGELSQFQDECLNLRERITHAEAFRALSKLILACEKAAEREMGLLLISD